MTVERKPPRTVAVLGASRDREKYGNRSVRSHHRHGWIVYPINPHADEIEGLRAYPNLAAVPAKSLDRISVYLPPDVGLRMLEEIARAGAAEVWFNPGSADARLREEAEALGLPVVEACSIVDVETGG